MKILFSLLFITLAFCTLTVDHGTRHVPARIMGVSCFAMDDKVMCATELQPKYEPSKELSKTSNEIIALAGGLGSVGAVFKRPADTEEEEHAFIQFYHGDDFSAQLDLTSTDIHVATSLNRDVYAISEAGDVRIYRSSDKNDTVHAKVDPPEGQIMAKNVRPHLSPVSSKDRIRVAVVSSASVDGSAAEDNVFIGDFGYDQSGNVSTFHYPVGAAVQDLVWLSYDRLLLLTSTGLRLAEVVENEHRVKHALLKLPPFHDDVTKSSLYVAPSGDAYIATFTTKVMVGVWSADALAAYTIPDSATGPAPPDAAMNVLLVDDNTFAPTQLAFIGTNVGEHIVAYPSGQSKVVLRGISTANNEVVGTLALGTNKAQVVGISYYASTHNTGGLAVAGSDGAVYIYENCNYTGHYAPVDPRNTNTSLFTATCQETAKLNEGASSALSMKTVLAGAVIDLPFCQLGTSLVAPATCALECSDHRADAARVHCALDTPHIDTARTLTGTVWSTGLYRAQSPGLRYSYYDLPVPHPAHIKRNKGFSDRLHMDESEEMLYKMPDVHDHYVNTCYPLPTPGLSGCDTVNEGVCTLSHELAKEMSAAIRSDSRYTMRIFDLDVNNIPVGIHDISADSVYTQLNIELGINHDNKVVTAKVTPSNAVLLYPLGQANTTGSKMQWSYCIRLIEMHIPYSDRYAISADGPKWPWAYFGIIFGLTAVTTPVCAYFALRRKQIDAVIAHAVSGPLGEGGASRLRRALYRRPAHPEIMALILGVGAHLVFSLFTLLLIAWMAETVPSSTLVTRFSRGLTAWIGPLTYTAAALAWTGAFVAGVVYKLYPDRKVLHAWVPWVRMGAIYWLTAPLAALTCLSAGYLITNVGTMGVPYGDMWIFFIIYIAISAPLTALGFWGGRTGGRWLGRASASDSGLLQVIDGSSELGDADILDDHELQPRGQARVVADMEVTPTQPQPFEPPPAAVALGVCWISRARRWLRSFGTPGQKVAAYLALPTGFMLGYNPTAENDRNRDEDVSEERTQLESVNLWGFILVVVAASACTGLPIFGCLTAFKAALWGASNSPPMAMILFAGICFGLIAYLGTGPLLASYVLAWRGERWGWPAVYLGVSTAAMFMVAFLCVPDLPSAGMYGLFAALASVAAGVMVIMPAYAGSLMVVRRMHAVLATMNKSD